MTQADGTRSWVARTRIFLIINWIFCWKYCWKHGNISNCILDRLPVRERCQVNIAGQTYRLPERWGIICWDGMTSSANWSKGPSSSSTTTVPPYRCAFQVPSSRLSWPKAPFFILAYPDFSASWEGRVRPNPTHRALGCLHGKHGLVSEREALASAMLLPFMVLSNEG